MFYEPVIISHKGISLDALSRIFGCVDINDSAIVEFWEKVNNEKFASTEIVRIEDNLLDNTIDEFRQIEELKKEAEKEFLDYRNDWFSVSFEKSENSVSQEYAMRYVNGHTVRDYYYVTPILFVEKEELNTFLIGIGYTAQSYFFKRMYALMYEMFKETAFEKTLRLSYLTEIECVSLNLIQQVGIVFKRDSKAFSEFERDFARLKNETQKQFPLIFDIDETQIYLIDNLNRLYLLDKHGLLDVWCKLFFLKEFTTDDNSVVCQHKNFENISAFSRINCHTRDFGRRIKEDNIFDI